MAEQHIEFARLNARHILVSNNAHHPTVIEEAKKRNASCGLFGGDIPKPITTSRPRNWS